MADVENGNGSLLAGMPKWARIIAYLGFPAAVAAYLLHFFVSTMGGTLSAQSQMLNSHITDSRVHDQKLGQFFTLHEQQETMIRAILSQICVNGAKSDTDRKACIPTK